MARLSKRMARPRRSSSTYGGASAADIARNGVRTRRPGQADWGLMGGSEQAWQEDDGTAIVDSPVSQSEAVRVVQPALASAPAYELVSAMPKSVSASRSIPTQTKPTPKPAQAASLRAIPLAETDRLADEDKRAMRKKVGVSAAILVVLSFFSLCVVGPSSEWGQMLHTPADVVQMLIWHVQSLFAGYPYDFSTMVRDYPYFFAMADKAGVVGITLVCAVLLSISGMLYQNVFKNPIAGPGMLGVSSGVTLGMMILVYQFGVDALSKVPERYLYCYLLGAAVLAFVILAGRKLSGKGKPFDIVTMLLIGSLIGQLVGFVVSYYTLFVMDPDLYQVYITLSQMLVVDTSVLSWVVLGIACAVSLVPVWLLRFRLNALAFDEQEVKLLGINMTALRAVALICGAVMILAAQIHIGSVAMVSLIVPFLSRSWFGCEFRKQLIGNMCIGTILLLVCRDIVDLIPFVGDGIGIGSAVSVMALPLFLLIMAKHLRGWD